MIKRIEIRIDYRFDNGETIIPDPEFVREEIADKFELVHAEVRYAEGVFWSSSTGSYGHTLIISGIPKEST